LRDQSARRTIAGGTVIDPFSPSRGRAAPRRISWLQAMSQEIPEEAVGQLLAQSPAGFDLDRFARAWNLTHEEADELFTVLQLKRIDDGITSWGFAPRHWQAYRQSLLSAVTDWHRQKPQSLGPHDYELDRIIAVKIPVALLRQAIHDLIEDGHLTRKGSIVHIPSHSPCPSDDDLKLWEKVEPLIRDGGLRPPLVRELAADLSMELRQLERFLHRAAQLGWLIMVTENRYFTPEAVLALANVAETLAAEANSGEFNPGSYRDRSAIGRNLTIEVLEFFDKTGFTRRTANERRINAPAREIFAPSSKD
jgi:selenocysteine-specific elongation factor